jgi:hypothetical protein
MFTCQKMATLSEKAFSALKFHSIKPMVILQYDFKTVASRSQRKVKAGRLLVQKQLVMLGGSFYSVIPASTSVNRKDDSDTMSLKTSTITQH